jgi:heme-degrading monooxygenase HmoA
MSYVAINVLTVPDGNGATLEERFAQRAGTVEKATGFEGFQPLRPLEGTDQYLVFTRWQSQSDFEAWRSGMGEAAHRRNAGQQPAASNATLWTFEVAVDVTPKA